MLSTPIYNYIQSHGWVWPTLESAHFIGLCLLFGSLLIVDLRLIGAFKSIPINAITKYTGFAVLGFLINVITGVLFVFGDPQRYFINVAFQLKMLCIVLAIMNVAYLFLQLKFNEGKSAPSSVPFNSRISVKFTAAMSLVFWTSVIVLGRLIPYVE